MKSKYPILHTIHRTGTNEGLDGSKQDEQVKATKIHNRAMEFRRETPTLSLATAYLMAQREIESGESSATKAT